MSLITKHTRMILSETSGLETPTPFNATHLMDINDRWLLLCAFLWLAGGSGCWITTNMIGLRYLFHFFCFCRWLRENHRRSWPRFCRWQSRQCIRTKRSVWLEITFALFSLCALVPLITLCLCINAPRIELRLRLLWHFEPQRLFYLCMRYTSY